ncbi:mitochondrial fission ELM1 family protein [Pseudomaricurvus sp. HS19]|uniref:mitochondrial fission ELM1 family protein n=1 Tax=Pseudomaricurvus sp. HS19 TaxID=2692626 RepID=UPI00136B54AE|nr:ELM1/GtrOC1 family putative glycosyltransferase [Pseudomaricurvus sp. HS19]MYM63384.1 hypothetical protein [Pseudomaricurvus sp. HS19]
MNILCVTDDKSGHVSQLRGLAEALGRLTPTDTRWQSIYQPSGLDPSFRPDLILGAGRRTHWPALKMKLRRGGRVVLLSKPTLPQWLFDLCVLPRHDGQQESRRVVNTEGALNPILPSTEADPDRGLLLIGGPSNYYGWDTDSLVQQLLQLQASQPQIRWTLTTSRRTPDTFPAAIPQLRAAGIDVVPLEETDHQWLLDHFRQCGVIWVTEDSVSMVYEALSSGARVGLLQMPLLKANRLSDSFRHLAEAGRLMQIGSADPTRQFAPLQEADRIAKLLLARWPAEQE